MVGLIITIIVTVPVAVMWGLGISKMKDNHPDYKGEDFLNWDDNKTHSEGSF